MALDVYSFCPCGSGKKLKFCCRDLMSDLEKLERMYEGEQFRAAMEHVQQLEKRHPRRMALQVMRGRLHSQLKNADEARTAFAEVLEQDPHNTTALAHMAVLSFGARDVRASIDFLQRALDEQRDPMPGEVFEVLSSIAAALAYVYPVAARAHLQLTLAADPDHKDSAELLRAIDSSDRVPLVLKDDRSLRLPPQGCEQADSWDDTVYLARIGRWKAAEAHFVHLTEAAPEEPDLWFNLALVRSWLADDDGAAEAFRRYAALTDSVDEAVEAEAMAMALVGAADDDAIPLTRITYSIDRLDPLREKLASDSRVRRMNVDLSQYAGEGEPPPQAVFRLLDRPLPESSEGLSHEGLPRVAGQLALYGKQTDRDARVEFIALEDTAFADTQSLLQQIAGELLGTEGDHEVLDAHAGSLTNVEVRRDFPPQTAPDRARALWSRCLEEEYLERWPDVKMATLDNHTPAEAAREDKLRHRLLAIVLLAEQSSNAGQPPLDFDRVREGLGLPATEPIDPATVDVSELPSVRWHRIKIEGLSDEQLIELFSYAIATRAAIAAYRFALAILERESLDQRLDKSRVYAELVRLESDPKDALEHVTQGRTLTEARGGSCAGWDFQELNLRAALGEAPEVERLIDHLANVHIREPGVRQALTQFLAQVGAIDAQGRPTQPQAEPESNLVLPEDATKEERIWTPGADEPSGERPALWTPGSE